MTNHRFKYDVFLSHSSKDETVALELAEHLKAGGLRVWFDKWEIKAGDMIPSKIEDGLEAARNLVLLMSEAAFKSKWVELERQTFRFRDLTNEEQRFVPLLVNDCEIKDSIKPFRFVDYRSNKEAAIKELITACLPAVSLPAFVDRFGADESAPMFSAECIRPLHETEDRFLQLLLSSFSIVRREDSTSEAFELQISFDDSTPAIWDQRGKRHLLKSLLKEKRAKFQRKLDHLFLEGGGDPFELRNEDAFVFRYASGGTLPIITFTGNGLSGQYYSLFYRDVYPVGWNIANGGTDSRAELLNPQETIERELQEELIIADFIKDERYVFPIDAGKPIDHPAHAVARRLWTGMFPHKKLTNLKEATIQVDKWVQGPDSVRIQVGDETPIRKDGFFLNINGDDFGIEFDRVAKFRLPGNVILFDGELDGAYLVNSPVGLFEVNKFNELLKEKNAQFRPDYFFFAAALHNGSYIDYVLEKRFIPHLMKFRTPEEIEYLSQSIKEHRQYDLCPVTGRIANRFLKNGR